MSYRSEKSSPLGLLLGFALMAIIIIYSLKKRNSFHQFKVFFDTVFIRVFNKNEIYQIIKTLNEYSIYNFSVSDFTGIKLNDELFPVIFGDVDYKKSLKYNSQKTVFIVSQNKQQTEILKGYSQFFKFACNANDHSVFWVKRLSKLKGFIVSTIRNNERIC